MNHKNIVINPSISGISLALDFPLLPDHANLVKKYRENLKLPNRPLGLNILFNAKLVALLTEDDPMLNPIVKALENSVETINANSPTSNILPEIYMNPTDCYTWTVNSLYLLP